jgi:hypothetical protein
MDVRLVPPIFPRPPDNYKVDYFSDLVRALASLVTYVSAVGEGRQTTIVLTNLATNDVGLEKGTIFQVDGALRISAPNLPYVKGSSVKGSVGSVTVMT